MRALEAGDNAAIERVKAEKERLRDDPANPRIATAKTVDELKCITV